MTEDQLQAEVTALCDRLGLLWHHCPFARRCDGTRGLPDLIIAGKRGVIFRELKSSSGETSADQDLWGWALRQQGMIGYEPLGIELWDLWRPADWHSGRISAELKSLC